MTEEPRSPIATFEPFEAVDGDAPRQESPFAVAARALRGRWRIALTIAGVLAVGGAVGGFLSQKALYTSKGFIEITPVMPRILHRADNDGQIPGVDQYIETQAALVSSSRIREFAMDHPEWRKLRRARTDEQTRKFDQSLSVSRIQRSYVLAVNFTDEDPEAARLSVNAVLKAYKTYIGDRESESEESRFSLLENRRAALNNELDSLRRDLQTATGSKGKSALDEQYEAAAAQLLKLQGKVNDLDLEIATLRSVSVPEPAAGEAAGKPEVPAVPVSVTPEELALREPMMQELLRKRDEAEKTRAYLQAPPLSLGSNHPDVLTADFEVKTAQGRVDAYVEAARLARAKSKEQRLADAAEREAERTSVVTLRNEMNDELTRLGNMRKKVEDIEAEQKRKTEQLEEVKQRLDQLRMEGQSITGRIATGEGDRPISPSRDRRIPMGVLGALAGIALGLGSVVAYGVRANRVRHISDVGRDVARERVIGILPEVRQDGAEGAAESAEMGDYCVHHLRAMLQVCSRETKRSIALTSPSAGAGKTTLSLALGASFAATGSRTLVVDCDLVGHGLTSTLRSLVCEDAARALGGTGEASGTRERSGSRMVQLLEARRLSFDDTHVTELLAAARDAAAAGIPAGARATQLLERFTTVCGTNDPAGRGKGILGVLDGARLEDCIVEVGDPALAVLPVGSARAGDAERLSVEGLKQLLATCQRSFDIVLIDTGPVLGSLEATLAASVAESVLVVVARGERKALIDDAIARLAQFGAPSPGVVFNRATSEDVIRSNYASRSASIPATVS